MVPHPHPPIGAHAPYDYARIQRYPGMGWHQNGHKLRNFKPKKAFVWPKDGKNGSTLGRLRDIMTNKGPDIFVTLSGNAGDAMRDRPLRSQWSRWKWMNDGLNPADLQLNDPWFLEDNLRSAPWVRAVGGSDPTRLYDFRTRKYGRANPYSWSDARWRSSNDKEMYPLAFRHHLHDHFDGHNYGEYVVLKPPPPMYF